MKLYVDIILIIYISKNKIVEIYIILMNTPTCTKICIRKGESDMYLYTEQTSMDGIYGEQTTPAHLYEGTNNLSTILDDMLKGAIPFNTKHVYPTVWKSEKEILEKMRQGFYPNGDSWLK